MEYGWLEWGDLIVRWIHVVAAVAWVGFGFFFSFVNAQVAKTYTPDAKKRVAPELMPRALYWLRWGAAWGFLSGAVLLALEYYWRGALVAPETGLSAGAGVGISVAALGVGFVAYDLLWRRLEGRQLLGALASFALLGLLLWGLSLAFTPRGVWIHLGAVFGTIMAGNAWMRIWPNQRKNIAAIRAGSSPDPARVALVALRSKHNTYLAVPLVLSMVSHHAPAVHGSGWGWGLALGAVAVGWGATRWLYKKSAAAAPAAY